MDEHLEQAQRWLERSAAAAYPEGHVNCLRASVQAIIAHLEAQAAQSARVGTTSVRPPMVVLDETEPASPETACQHRPERRLHLLMENTWCRECGAIRLAGQDDWTVPASSQTGA